MTLFRIFIHLQLDSQKVFGFGATEKFAKKQVAENALRTLVENPNPGMKFTPDCVKNRNSDVWKSILSYSVYKLLTDWNEGRIGLQPRKCPV